MFRSFSIPVLLAALCLPACSVLAQHVRPSAEARAVAAFNTAKASGALDLHAFLERMPKGGDLHMHLSGAIYAETFLKDAAEDGMCVDMAKLAMVKGSGVCPAGDVAAGEVFKDQKLYDALIDSFSMRAFTPTPGLDGHDQFFATFGRFGGIGKQHHAEWVDEVATRAAAQNEQYLEIMDTPSFGRAAALGYRIGWPGGAARPVTTAATSIPDLTAGTSFAELGALREKLLAGGLREEVATDREEYASALAGARAMEQCGTAQARPACAVDVRFLFQVLRAFPPQQVFAQTLLAFEVAEAERVSPSVADRPLVVGLNFVQPEDAYLAMSEYHRQMLMLKYLRSVYPQVHLSLHAGELAPGLVPPEGLAAHIREAVEVAGAERIGHGVDVMYETDPQGLLREMAAKHVMVEVNLTSNDVILGVRTNQHSLPGYLRAGVPVALSTDDEGVSRINLTHEYARAAVDFGLGYLDLKRSARTSLEYSFLPGKSLWAETDSFGKMVPECAGKSERCAGFLKINPRAAAEWELERRFGVFEGAL